MIPIIISVTTRTEYLPYMVNSLLASKLLDAKLFIHANKDNQLYQAQTTYNKPLQRQLQHLKLPVINSTIIPLSKYFDITVTKQDLLHVQKVKAILTKYFTELSTDYIIYLKDDCIFNRDWLIELLKLYDKLKSNLGFIAGCDLNTGILQPRYIQTQQNLQRGYIACKAKKDGRYGSSQCYLITREFFEKWKSAQLPSRIAFNTTFNDSTDIIMNQACVALNFKNYLMVPQYVQHIGVHSTRFHNRKMPFTHNFKTPYCYGHFVEVKR